jgi:hypothetical protein
MSFYTRNGKGYARQEMIGNYRNVILPVETRSEKLTFQILYHIQFKILFQGQAVPDLPQARRVGQS